MRTLFRGPLVSGRRHRRQLLGHAGPTDGPSTSDAPTTGQASASASTSPGSETGDSSGDASTGDCDDDCEIQPPTLLWSLETADIYGDGACLDIIDDGQGGLFASYVGYGFETYSDVLAVNADGELTAKGRGADAGPYNGLAPRGPGLFGWAARSGHVGIADDTLQNLDVGQLTYDVAPAFGPPSTPRKPRSTTCSCTRCTTTRAPTPWDCGARAPSNPATTRRATARSGERPRSKPRSRRSRRSSRWPAFASA